MDQKTMVEVSFKSLSMRFEILLEGFKSTNTQSLAYGGHFRFGYGDTEDWLSDERNYLIK